MLVAWPWAQLDPFVRPLQAAARASQFHWQSPVMFGGRYVMSTDLPWTYLPTWFAITLPETYLLAAFSALAVLAIALRDRSSDARRMLSLVLLLASVALPFAGVLLTHAVLYDAHRHFLFCLPQLAALAGLAFDAFLAEPALQRLRRLGVGAFVLVAALTLFDIVSLHPYQYTYFNRLFGGLPAAIAQYETDYWGASYREAFLWVERNIRRPSGHPIRIAACGANHQLAYFVSQLPGANARFQVVHRYAQAEIFLAFTRDGCHLAPGEVLHTVERQATPLSVVIRR